MTQINLESYVPFRKGHFIFDAIFLITICFAGFGIYFTYDMSSTIATDIMQVLHIDVAKYMKSFYTLYAYPAAFSAMFSGIIIDKYLGLGWGGVTFGAITVIAHLGLVYCFTVKSSLLAALSRLFYGTASEPLGVIRSAYVSKYFNSALFYGLVLAFSRAGSVGGIKITPKILCAIYSEAPSCNIGIGNDTSKIDEDIDSLNNSKIESESDLATALSHTYFLGVSVTLLSMTLMFILMLFDNKIEKKQSINRVKVETVEKKETIKLSDFKNINLQAWTLIYVFTVWYSAMFPFNSMLPEYMKSYCGYSKDAAANLASIVYGFSVIGSPIFGHLIDKTRHHSCWLFLSSLLATSSFMLWGFLQPIIKNKDTMYMIMVAIMLCLGVAYCIIASSLMAYLAAVTETKLHATVFGLLFGVQQLGVGTSSYLGGLVVNKFGWNYLFYYLVVVGLLAISGNILLLCKDGINPLPQKSANDGNEICDITVSRLSFLNQSRRASLLGSRELVKMTETGENTALQSQIIFEE